ncbi:MAG: hypothetical protein C0600_11130 [Ignavibacteria bacterium]|nr:MAG: hypothetical protein C0600_11130 [Ignavibacteria bacterium]
MLDSARSVLGVNPDSAAAIVEHALPLAEDEKHQAMGQELLAEAQFRAGRKAAAVRAYGHGIELARRTQDDQLRARLLNGAGTVFRSVGQYDVALEYHLSSLTLFDSLGNSIGKAQALHDMAEALLLLGQENEAWQAHQRALNLRLAEDHQHGIAESYNSLGRIYWRRREVDSALVLFQAALTQQKKLGLLRSEVAISLNDIGNVHLGTGDVARAMEYYREAQGIAESTGDRNILALVSKSLAVGYRTMGDCSRAIMYLEQAEDMAQTMRLGALLGDVYEERSRCAEAMNQETEALHYYRRTIHVRDSLRSLINTQRLKEAEFFYLHERQELQQQDFESSRAQDLVVFAVVVSILLAIVALIALYVLRLKAKANRDLQTKNDKIHDMNVQLKELNTELANSEMRYRLLFEHLPVGVFLFDAHLMLMQVNDSFVEILGGTRESLEGMNLNELRDKRILHALRSALDGQKGAYEGEYELITGKGSTDISIRTAPVRDTDDSTLFGIGFVLDISNWKRIERELIESKELAEQADKMKNAFITNISHEIRTPLNIIMGYFGILQADLRERLSTEELDHFSKVDLAVRRLLRTVDQILNLSILESGTFTLNIESVSLFSLIEELVEEMRPLAEEKGLKVLITPSCENVTIEVDRYSFSHAVRNVLDNAVKFTDEGTISVSLACRDRQASVIIEDTGIGMSDKYIQRLYLSFSQEEDGYSRPYEGLGLGLTLTQRYIDANNGTILVRSKKGLGTTFTIGIPILAGANASPEKGLVGETDADVILPADGPPRVLVVEDDPETQKFLNLILSEDYALRFADSAPAAWDILVDEAFDLILMDISLRGEEDGLHLTQRIRENPDIAHVPIIAVTAHAFADDRQRSLDAGCNDYLPKPFRMKQLRELVEQFVR